MQAMIFAAGLGTRLKPFTDQHPKALAVVNGKTLLQRNIEHLKASGFNFVVINVFYLAEQIIAYLKNNNGFGIDYIISNEQPEILETGGGLANAFSLFKKNEPILTMNADILTDYNLHTFMQQHQHKRLITLAVAHRASSRQLLVNQNNLLCGWKNNTTQEERIIKPQEEQYQEKAFSGISIFDYAIQAHFLQQKKYSLIDLFLEAGRISSIYCQDFSSNHFIDVGKPASLLSAEQLFM